MTDLYENLLKATDNTNDITTERYATITKITGNLCSVKEYDNDIEHQNVPIVNGAKLETGDKVVIGFLNNSIYDVVCYGVLDRIIEDETVEVVTSWEQTLSDEKVPSEKLVKQSLDGKANTNHNHNIFNLDQTSSTGSTALADSDDSNGQGFSLGDGMLIYNQDESGFYYDTDGSRDADSGNELAVKKDIPSLTNYIQKSDTQGLIKNDGSIDTNSYSQTNHTHTWTSQSINTYATLYINTAIRLCELRYVRDFGSASADTFYSWHTGAIPSSYRPSSQVQGAFNQVGTIYVNSSGDIGGKFAFSWSSNRSVIGSVMWHY